MAESKVTFGLKNVHYSKITWNAGVPTYATPVAIKGAVNLVLDPSGEKSVFYADNGKYFVAYNNTGYSGNLEIAKVEDTMMSAIFGLTLGGTSKVLTENATVEAADIALLFQIDGDADEELYVIYNIHPGRPAIGSQTLQDQKTPQTRTIPIEASPLATGVVSAKTTADTPAATRSGWFTTVFQES